MLALLKQRVTHPSLALIVTAMASPIAAFENRLDEALAASEAVLADPNASPWAVEYAAFGGMLALALMGRGSEVAPMASRFHDVMNATDGLLRYPASLGEMLGMIHAGQLDLAQRRADESTEFSSAGHFLAWAMANILLGMVDLAKGRLPDAATRNEQALAALTEDSVVDVSVANHVGTGLRRTRQGGGGATCTCRRAGPLRPARRDLRAAPAARRGMARRRGGNSHARNRQGAHGCRGGGRIQAVRESRRMRCTLLPASGTRRWGSDWASWLVSWTAS